MDQSQKTSRTTAKSETLPLTRWKIVVADDEPDELTYLASVFEDHGATVLRATNGDEALAMVQSAKLDLLTSVTVRLACDSHRD